MDASEVESIVREEIGDQWFRTNLHHVDLARCVVFPPRKIRCRNTFPHHDRPKPRYLDLWLVLEEEPGSSDGYLIVFDDSRRVFGLADWGDDRAVFWGFHGTFLDTLDGM